MDGRQLVQRDTGSMHAGWTEYAKRTAAARENGIGEKITPGRFDEKRGMVDPCGADGAGGERRAGLGCEGNGFGPASGSAGKLPAQDIAKAWDGGAVRVVEKASVAVVGNGKAFGGRHGGGKVEEIPGAGNGGVMDGKKITMPRAAKRGQNRAAVKPHDGFGWRDIKLLAAEKS